MIKKDFGNIVTKVSDKIIALFDGVSSYYIYVKIVTPFLRKALLCIYRRYCEKYQ